MKIGPIKLSFAEPPGLSVAWPSHRGAGAAPIHPVEPASDGWTSAQTSLTMRMVLLVGCATSVALAVAVGDPSPYLTADLELARLLRGMAVLKALMVAAGLGAIGWRMGNPMERRTAALYVVGASAVAGATALIWQLTWLGPASLVFHVGGILLLLVAFADGRCGRAALTTTEVKDFRGSIGR